MADGTKEVHAVSAGLPRVGRVVTAAVTAEPCKARGLDVPKVLATRTATWASGRRPATCEPEAGEQRRWNHKMADVLERVGPK